MGLAFLYLIEALLIWIRYDVPLGADQLLGLLLQLVPRRLRQCDLVSSFYLQNIENTTVTKAARLIIVALMTVKQTVAQTKLRFRHFYQSIL